MITRDALETCITSAPAFSAIVIDSLSGLETRAQKDGYVGESHVGIFARIMSDTFPKIVPALQKNDCTLLVINQIREKIGVMFGNPEKSTGGRALRFYSTVRLDLRTIETFKRAGEIIGNITRVKVIKNKIAAPFKETKIIIEYGKGIKSDIVRCAIEEGIIERSGSKCIYKGIEVGNYDQDAMVYLEEHPDLKEEITKRLREDYKTA